MVYLGGFYVLADFRVLGTGQQTDAGSRRSLVHYALFSTMYLIYFPKWVGYFVFRKWESFVSMYDNRPNLRGGRDSCFLRQS